MSLLFSHLRVHQVFGANTDVGKTLLTSALVRASATKGKETYYLKPASTGPLSDADDEYVKRYAGDHRNKIKAHCLFRYNEPVSPHLAAKLAQADAASTTPSIPSDDTFIGAIAAYVRECSSRVRISGHMYVETAGGVHSPTLSGTTQVDSYRPLRLPTILIGDSRLGGISATISAYESLTLRGYDVDAVLLFREDYYRNWEFLEPYFGERGLKVGALATPPEKHADAATNFTQTDQWYQKLLSPADSALFDILSHLDERHIRRLEELHSMPRRTLDTIWWPFVQHGLYKNEQDVNVIDSAHGDVFSVFKTSTDKTDSLHTSVLQPQFDGSASWWTQAFGHANPSLTLAAARAAGRYGHVMFPQCTHTPALKLAERLVKSGPGKGWASRAFFSDDGSTGMEVAIKMALRAFSVRDAGGLHDGQDRQKRRDLGILGLKGSYHGDTIGAMDACEEGVYTCEWHEAKGYWFDPPSVSIRKGRIVVSLPPAIASETQDGKADIVGGTVDSTYDVEKRLTTPLADTYRRYITGALEKLSQSSSSTLAALVLEPIVMGAGGMIFVDPLFQRVLIDVVRSRDTHSGRIPGDWQGLPVIFDEVFIGLYRLGFETATSILGVNPDISVHAKVLTGGLVPLAVTMASESIFDSFYNDKKADALLHGHSYTAYPVGCEVANETLGLIEKLSKSDEWLEAQNKWQTAELVEDAQSSSTAPRIWSFWDPSFVNALSHLDVVEEVMTLGTVLAFKVSDNTGGYQSHSAQTILSSIGRAAVDENSSSPVLGGAPYCINYRTLGNIAYFMLSLNTSKAMVRSVEDRIWSALSAHRR
ncbi:onanonoxo-7-onima-8-eninoihtemlysoneda [Irpex rosettiformis]|uniref:Onanonoxo-7-onima-8-eninoihtemlysoneda n=1 Tax=Irpex rosettiformis TaxID=378272 RepID=A0ACB8U7E6_9APHY|nr:onanonoxo-7-onima-8-eninoihtemlysoneda [Irpex rosettiformis]